MEPKYAAFTVNAVSANSGTLTLNLNHAVKLNLRDETKSNLNSVSR
jgi:hypothetical protein